MPLINCKIKFNMENFFSVFIINDTKMYVPVVALSKEDNKDFIEQQNKGFQRSIYCKEYKTKELNATVNNDNPANVVRYINLVLLFKVLIYYLLWHIIA